MAVGSGIGAQVGLAAESTYGTGVTATRFIESMDFKGNPKKNVYQGGGLRAGGFVERASRRVVTSRAFAPSFSADVLPNGFGLILKQAFGSTSAPVQQAATAAWLQTFTLADLGSNLSATIQSGEPNTGGTSNPYTYLGCRCTELEFTQELDKALNLATTWDARDRTEATALATASFSGAAQQAFHWGVYSIKIANTLGAEVAVDGITKVTTKIARPQDTGRFYANDNAGVIAGVGLHKVPILNGRKDVVTGTISADFVTKADLRDRFNADTGFSMVQQWTLDNIASTFFEQLTITTPRCYLNDDGTGVDGEDLLKGDFPFVIGDDGTNEPITVTYMSTDTTN